jgi:hypothetical protein
VQGTLEVPDGVLVGQHEEGAIPRAPSELDGLVDLAVHRRLAIVVRDLRQMRREVRGVHLLHRLGERAVQRRTVGAAQIVVQHVAHEHVREAEPTDRVADAVRDAGCARLIERVVHGRRRDRGRGDPLDHGGVELAALHRRDRQHPPNRPRQRDDALADRRSELFRNRQAHRATLAPASRLLRHPQADHFGEEQGISLCGRVHGIHRRARNGPRRGPVDVACDRSSAQPAQRDRSSLADDVRQDLTHQRIARRVDVAIGADDEERQRAQVARDKAQEQQRRLIRRMQIVEKEHKRLIRGGGAQELRSGVQYPE